MLNVIREPFEVRITAAPASRWYAECWGETFMVVDSINNHGWYVLLADVVQDGPETRFIKHEDAEVVTPVKQPTVVESTAEGDDHHPLLEIFNGAIAQVSSGKGEERHGKGKPFMKQPWLHYADKHGVGFLTGQAAKKLDEAQSFDDQDRWEREMFGVLVYAAMAIKYRRMKKEGNNA